MLGNLHTFVYQNKGMITFGPSFPHSTMKEGRKCEDCHHTQIPKDIKKNKFYPVVYEKGDFGGRMFWDGRATGARLNDPLAEQAGGPFLNPLEQNNPDKKAVVMKVKSSDYAPLFEQVWNIKKEEWEKNVDKIYEDIARSRASRKSFISTTPEMWSTFLRLRSAPI